MDSIRNSISRIHPLVAAAAVSVILVSLAGTAAITGLLPSSHGAPEAAAMNPAQTAPVYGATAGYAPATQQPGVQGMQPVQGAYGQPLVSTQPVAAEPAPAPAPVVIEKTIIKEVPAKPHHHTNTNYARNDGYAAPAARPAAQPNYMAIGTGAVIGGLVGNQVGSGNGRKLATVAGVIGGGLLGNQIANQR